MRKQFLNLQRSEKEVTTTTKYNERMSMIKLRSSCLAYEIVVLCIQNSQRFNVSIEKSTPSTKWWIFGAMFIDRLLIVLFTLPCSKWVYRNSVSFSSSSLSSLWRFHQSQTMLSPVLTSSTKAIALNVKMCNACAVVYANHIKYIRVW